MLRYIKDKDKAGTLARISKEPTSLEGMPNQLEDIRYHLGINEMGGNIFMKGRE